MGEFSAAGNNYKSQSLTGKPQEHRVSSDGMHLLHPPPPPKTIVFGGGEWRRLVFENMMVSEG